MKTILLTVALFATVACAAPKNKRDVSHLLKDGEYLPPYHHEHNYHHHEEESAPQPRYQYPVPQASLNNRYLAPQPSVNNQYLAPQPSVNNQYLAPITKASEPEEIQFPSTSYGVPVKAAPVPAPMEVAAPAKDHLIFDAPALEQDSFIVESVGKSSSGQEYAQQPIGSNGGYVYERKM